MTSGLSVIIPCYCEPVANLLETINHIKSLPGNFNLEIVVADGSPTPLSELSLSQAKFPFKLIHSEPGRGIQLNKGVAASKEDLILFLHADTRLPLQGLIQIEDQLQNKSLCGGAFDLGSKPIATSFLSKKTIEIIFFFARLRSRATRVPYGDQAIFIRRQDFLNLNGFKNFPIMEDLEFMTRIRKSGRRITILPSRVETSTRRWAKEGVLRASTRNILLRLCYHLGAHPGKLAGWYRPNST